MRLNPPVCPECGAPWEREVNTVQCLYGVRRDEDGSYRYDDTYEDCIDTVEAVTADNGGALFLCENEHEHGVLVLPDKEGNDAVHEA